MESSQTNPERSAIPAGRPRNYGGGAKTLNRHRPPCLACGSEKLHDFNAAVRDREHEVPFATRRERVH